MAVLVAVLVPLATPYAAVADPRDDQERIDEEVAEAEALLEHATERAQRAAARYAEADAALPGAQARLDEARGEVAAAQTLADSAERAAERAADELTAASARYDTAATGVERARDDVTAFSVAAYKGGRLAGFTLLLQARDPGEVGERLGYLDHVASVEQAAIDDLVTVRLAARQAENEATLAHARAERARRAAVAALERAERAETAAEQAAAEADELAETRDAAMAVAEAERDETLIRYEEAERASEQIAAEVREWEASQTAPKLKPKPKPKPKPQPPPAAAGGQSSGAMLASPTEGWQSSAYGMRYDPFYGVWQMHEGMDIAAPGGTPIYAAADGTVIRADWNGGYGNYTCLGHGTHEGQGLSTCYAHQSEILVSDGQSVQRGEVIGRVGTTGASTGNHLHFEVRLDGSSTDPIPYLPGF